MDFKLHLQNVLAIITDEAINVSFLDSPYFVQVTLSFGVEFGPLEFGNFGDVTFDGF